MEKNYQQSKGSSAISNVSLSDDSDSNNEIRDDILNAQSSTQGRSSTITESNQANRKSHSSLKKIKCILCWSKKTLTDV